jgi:hypothetical protein
VVGTPNATNKGIPGLEGLPVDFTVIADVLCSKQIKLFEDPEHNRLSPHSLSRKQLHDLLALGPLTVMKLGASTLVTTGTLVDLDEVIEVEGENEDEALAPNEKNSRQLCSLDDKYTGKVLWDSLTDPFTQGGDSGALVWAEIRDRKVPLGIHIGLKEGISTFMLLSRVLEIIEEIYDQDYLFCSTCIGSM